MFGISKSTPTIDDGLQTVNRIFVTGRGVVVFIGEDCSVIAVKLEDIPPALQSQSPKVSNEEAIKIAKDRSKWQEDPKVTKANARLGILPSDGSNPPRFYWSVSLRKRDDFNLKRGICVDAESGAECVEKYDDFLSQPLPR